MRVPDVVGDVDLIRRRAGRVLARGAVLLRGDGAGRRTRQPEDQAHHHHRATESRHRSSSRECSRSAVTPSTRRSATRTPTIAPSIGPARRAEHGQHHQARDQHDSEPHQHAQTPHRHEPVGPDAPEAHQPSGVCSTSPTATPQPTTDRSAAGTSAARTAPPAATSRDAGQVAAAQRHSAAAVLPIELADQRVHGPAEPQERRRHGEDAAGAELPVRPLPEQHAEHHGHGQLDAEPGVPHRAGVLAGPRIGDFTGATYLLVKFFASMRKRSTAYRVSMYGRRCAAAMRSDARQMPG